MKIDVEGHEREAIAGMAGVLSKNFVLHEARIVYEAAAVVNERIKPENAGCPLVAL